MPTIGLTGVLAALSLATDLGSGFAPEKGLRTCVAAVAWAARRGSTARHGRRVPGRAAPRARVHRVCVRERVAFRRRPGLPAAPCTSSIMATPIVRPTSARGQGESGPPNSASISWPSPPPWGLEAAVRRRARRRVTWGREAWPADADAIAALDQVAERWDGAGFPGVARRRGPERGRRGRGWRRRPGASRRWASRGAVAFAALGGGRGRRAVRARGWSRWSLVLRDDLLGALGRLTIR